MRPVFNCGVQNTKCSSIRIWNYLFVLCLTDSDAIRIFIELQFKFDIWVLKDYGSSFTKAFSDDGLKSVSERERFVRQLLDVSTIFGKLLSAYVLVASGTLCQLRMN